ncbi:hypothetical protein MHZ95_07580 [Sporosarcina sp. ACRSM]|uniref:hypothetical protein n=1 Tax=Sporosarcina sp. ACRSM TaxID=2918216 RepID=UPI001EF5CF02|nr:hypothetical protein [Sporosarcina sp. ACRSM]MCG7335136.1 hypothetical protein [Sporosarcina sp. ACRSM]
MDIFLFMLAYIGIFGMPILGIIFCLNLVEVIKKIKNEQPTATNTFWLTTSFILIVWSIALLPATSH